MNRTLFFLLGVLTAALAFVLGLTLRSDDEGTFVTRNGETTVSGTDWKFAVDTAAGRTTATHGRIGITPLWVMKPDWFVRVKDDEPAWIFNGDDQLFAIAKTSDSQLTIFDLDSSPFPVPESVVRRIGEQRVRAMAEAARASRERLGLGAAAPR
jgi:hypothetical protein